MYSVCSWVSYNFSVSHQAFSAARTLYSAVASTAYVSVTSNLTLAMDSRGTFLPKFSPLAEVVAELQKVRADTFKG